MASYLWLNSINLQIRHYKVPGKLKRLINFSKVPKVDFEKEVREVLGRGSGPGGSKVNKSNNAVSLIHLETKVAVKSHDTRSVEKNKLIARDKLIDKLDWHFNGEDSVEGQVKKIEREREIERKERSKRRLEEKLKLKAEKQAEKENADKL